VEALYPEDPSTIGPYRLLGRLGEGGMGRVFLGRSPSGRMVAVKVVHGDLAREAHFRRRFRAEIDAARRVSGMWTAPVLDHDIESAIPWVATGYVAGPPLREVVDTLHGPLPEHSVWALAYGLASALLAVHHNGLIHRDLKPSNVMVTLEGPKVIDFGIARSADASVVTRTGGMVGSPGYMPPEQIRGEELTGAADIFAMGALLAYAATGKSPFSWDGAHAHTVMYRVLNDPPHLGPEDGRLKGDLRTLVLHCLAKNAGQRPSLAGIPAAAEKRAGTDYWLPSGLTARLGQVAANLLAFDGPQADRPPSTWGPQPPSAWDPRATTPATRSTARTDQTTYVPGAFEQSEAKAPAIAPSPLAPPPPPLRTPPTSPPPPATQRPRRYVLAAASGALTLTLGAWLIVASMGSGEANPQATDPNLIGDPRTADVCALTDTDALARFGDAQADVDHGNFDTCEVIIRPDDETRIDVSTYFLPGSSPEMSEPARTIGEIGVLEDTSESDECGLVLLPPDAEVDGILVGIRANLEDGEVGGGTATLCAVADEAAQSAAEVLNQGMIPRRAEAYPEDSLARVNACELLDAEALSAVPGLEGVAPEVGVANWECTWSSGIDELEVTVRFDRDQPESEGQRIQLSGHDAFVVPEGNGDETCTVFVEYREYGGHNAETAVEKLRLHVRGAPPMDELCDMARDLTASAAAELPTR
jgi:serine/threonine protein kinase